MRALIILFAFLLVPGSVQATSHFAHLVERPYTSPEDASRSVRALGVALHNKRDHRALFPLVYSLTIKATEKKLSRGEFKNPAWVRALIVNYANLYRRTIQAELNGKRATLPKAWQLEFNLTNSAGWNADKDMVYGIHVHIARDLVEALLITPTNFRSPSMRADYFLITEALSETMPEIWSIFLRYSDSFRLLPAIERNIMIEWIALLRERAWDQAVAVSAYSPSEKMRVLNNIDLKVARLSREHGILLPLLRF